MGSGQSTPKITQQDRAILDLKLQRDKLKQYQKKVCSYVHIDMSFPQNPLSQIQVILEREHQIARSHLIAGDKDRALIALRRRKYQQSLLLRTDDQLAALEQLVSTIEFSLVEVSVLHGLKQGNEVLKEIHREMSLESVERLMEETHEAREYQRVRHFGSLGCLHELSLYFHIIQEISNLLANQLTLEEEDAVQAELLELQAASLEPPIQSMLPSAPKEQPVVYETTEHDSLAQTEDAVERVALPG
ncbi:Snf7-domain-containing protein [Boletus reticuloceps]|uniref:Snf7-domain-containing protein n=1 Tax=Boletus reticuloceps TaxID=495285 RepID=A0A8I2Z1N2_9AGAM|nr:Snf7-domain-containing protein [Boletus reticuloceps]